MTPNRNPETKLSNEAAQALYEKIAGFDRAIDTEIERVKGATAAIANAYENANTAFAARKALAEELGRLAPDDFTPQSGLLSPSAPFSPSRRFARVHPFPRPRSTVNASNYSDDEERLY